MSSPSALADHLFGSTTPPPLPTATAMLLDDQDNDAEDGDLFGDDQDDDEESVAYILFPLISLYLYRLSLRSVTSLE